MTEEGVRVALGLGSNLGDRVAHLRFGRRELARWVEGMRCSALYETEPREVTDQPSFLNACCAGRTSLRPEEVLSRCREIEAAAGRRREGRRFGPRTLDIDLLLYGDRVVRGPGLEVPHPRMADRAFVLVPLAEVAPEWLHPDAGVTVGELARRVSPAGVRRLEGAEGEGEWGNG